MTLNYYDDGNPKPPVVQQPITDPNAKGYDEYWRGVLDGSIPTQNDDDDGFGLQSKIFEEAMKPAGIKPLGQETAAGDTPEQSATPEAFSKEWEYSSEESEKDLQSAWGYRYVDNMAELQNKDNFKSVFGDFIKSDEHARFLQEAFSLIGHHPRGQELYLHLIQLAKR
jgi:hypothetical protein